MKELRAKLDEMKEFRAELHEKWNTLTPPEIAEETAKLVAMGAALQKILTKDAKDCEGGHRPLGIFHEGTANPFEIGDPVTAGRRSRGAFMEDVVEKWNNDEWLPPREPETAVMTHKDVGGNIISQRTVKAIRR